MPFIPIPNCVKVEMVYEYHGERCENVFHNIMPVGYDSVDIGNLLDVYRNWWVTNRQAVSPDSLSLVEMVGTDQASETGPRVVDSTGLPAQGGDSVGLALPGNVTCVVTWSTDMRGRSFRGRTYHLGLKEGQVDGNTLNSATLTAFLADYAQLLADLALNVTPLGVASRFSDNAPRVTGIITEVTNVNINADIDSQRRRLAGRGR